MSKHVRQRLNLVKGRKHIKMSEPQDAQTPPTPQAVPITPVIVLGFDPEGVFRYVSQVDPAQTVFFLQKAIIDVAMRNNAKIDTSRIIVPPPGTVVRQ